MVIKEGELSKINLNKTDDHRSKIQIKYINSDEINKKVQKNIILKSGFSNKIYNTREKGRFLETMARIDSYIQDN